MTRYTGERPGFWRRAKEWKEMIAIVVSIFFFAKWVVFTAQPAIIHLYGAADRADSAVVIALSTKEAVKEVKLEVDTMHGLLRDSHGRLLQSDSAIRLLQEGQQKVLARLTAGGIAFREIDSLGSRHVAWAARYPFTTF